MTAQNGVLHVCLNRELKEVTTHPQIVSLFNKHWDPYGYYNQLIRPMSAPTSFAIACVAMVLMFAVYIAALPGVLLLRPFWPQLYEWTQKGRTQER